MVINNNEKSRRSLATSIILVIWRRLSSYGILKLPNKERRHPCSIRACKSLVIRSQAIEENASFNLLRSQDVQSHTSMKEHQYNSSLIMLL
jgi:hypothetical protein